MQIDKSSWQRRLKRYEHRFEKVLWRLRLVAILPVIMSLASTGVTFVLGTIEIGKAILSLQAMHSPSKVWYPVLISI